jgi:hypothetical protein
MESVDTKSTDMSTNPTERAGTAEPLLLKKQAAEIVGGYELLSQMMRLRKIQYIRLGHRSVRFRREDIEAALSRLTIRAIK